MSADPFAPRAELWALLEAAGIKADRAGGARLAQIPGVVVRAANPWMVPAGHHRRTWYRSSWDVLCVAGKTDAAATEAELGALVARVTLVLFGARAGAWSTPTWGGMLVYPQDGVDHLACVATMTTTVDLGADVVTPPAPGPWPSDGRFLLDADRLDLEIIAEV